MNYYTIQFLLQDEKTKIYSHLPVSYEVTTDFEVAKEWFDNAVKRTTQRYGNKLIEVREMKLDHLCTLKEAVFTCTEPAYKEGKYLINLRCYTHNPFEL